MGTKMVSLRLDEGLLAWATDYASSRGASRTKVVEAALRSFREDCVSGVPELESASGGVPPGRPGGPGESGKGDAPVARPPAPTRVPGVKTGRDLYDEQMLARQMRLNRGR